MRQYWWTSATPSPLIGSLHNFPREIFSRNPEKHKPELSLSLIENSCMPDKYKDNALLQLFQAGYFTLNMEEQNEKYSLRFPNDEVKLCFTNYLKELRESLFDEMQIELLRRREYKEFYDKLYEFFDKYPHEGNEFSFHSSLFEMLHQQKTKGEIYDGEPTVDNQKKPDITYIPIPSADITYCFIIELTYGESISAWKKKEKGKEKCIEREYVINTATSNKYEEYLSKDEVVYICIEMLFGKCKSGYDAKENLLDMKVFQTEVNGFELNIVNWKEAGKKMLKRGEITDEWVIE